MKIRINGETETIKDGEISVIDLLKIKDIEMPDMVSVQLNGSILNRDSFETTNIKDQDNVEFLYFMGGGTVGETKGVNNWSGAESPGDSGAEEAVR